MRFSSLKFTMTIAAFGLLLPGQSGCATSETPPPIEQDRFVEMDLNRDGKVVLEEFLAANPNMTDQAFIIIDRNKDNGIDRIEWIEFSKNHGRPSPESGAPMNNIPGDPLIPPPDSSDLPLMRPPTN